ncbi:ras-related protein Rap-2b-like [Clytia hemisphaerica]|uniref:ras-related protein Rap-2b-like n=1 Tax=Clytia hemisphaerica TaxID=252671 RepID=UPI0034D45380
MRSYNTKRRSRGDVIPYYDVAVLGETACGKSSIIEQLVNGSFTQTYTPTAAEVHMKTIRVDGRAIACLQLFDTAGGFEFPMVLKLTIKRCQAFIVTYSVGSIRSLKIAKQQLNLINEIKGRLTPCLLVGNKRDLDYTQEREVSFDMGLQTAVAHECAFIECSSKINFYVEEVFISMVRKIEHVANVKHQIYLEDLAKRSDKKERRRSSITSIRSFFVNLSNSFDKDNSDLSDYES